LTRKEDSLPVKIITSSFQNRNFGAKITQAELDFLLDSYYEARGWTKEGIPTHEKLENLNILELRKKKN
jgi:aldehyde:ferredoxin oxidoreductase